MVLELTGRIYARITPGEAHARGLAPWLLLFVAGTMLVGCGKRPTTEDKVVATFAVSELEKILQRAYFPPEYKERAKVALHEFKSKEPNTVPIFIYARLSYAIDPNEDYLNLMCFDEGRDLRGICVREQRRDANGVLALIEEDYPIFVDSLESWSLERRVIPVRIRDAGQRKDEKLWLEYENRCLRALIQEVVLRKRKNSTSVGATEKISVRDIPPLYISLPDPNHVDLQIRAYDRTGYQSEWINVDATGVGIR